MTPPATMHALRASAIDHHAHAVPKNKKFLLYTGSSIHICIWPWYRLQSSVFCDSFSIVSDFPWLSKTRSQPGFGLGMTVGIVKEYFREGSKRPLEQIS